MITRLTPGTYRVARAEYANGEPAAIHRVGERVTVTEHTPLDSENDIRVLNQRTGHHGWIAERNLQPVEITGFPPYIQASDRVSDLSSLVSALEELLAQAEADQETAHALYSAAQVAHAGAVEKTDALSAALRALKKYL